MLKEQNKIRKERELHGGNYAATPRIRDPLTSKKITGFEMDIYFMPEEL